MWDEHFEMLVRKYLPFLPADEPLAADTELREYGLDSIGTTELLASIESAYSVRFTDDALTLETFASPGVLWAALAKLI
ncbi:acyl carrier protein [Actinomadura sp. 7K507]|uniref:acyl carrier protein n=1 Tax=Actinomadura sp. 7K507 TaxID=2530365 RepID=UPI00104C7223|nr:acyl carrier protein [Actinomadura sp. 7K507]TDC92979.1 acyl carrier protein [Actinomadura sp. 7K507]